jgi:hypothetical protein
MRGVPTSRQSPLGRMWDPTTTNSVSREPQLPQRHSVAAGGIHRPYCARCRAGRETPAALLTIWINDQLHAASLHEEAV